MKTSLLPWALALLCALALPVLAEDLFGEQESYVVGAEFESTYGVNYSPQEQSHLEYVGTRLVALSSLSTHPFFFAILNNPTANAVSLPYGLIYINQGMFNVMKSDDELAFVVGHEISHITLEHARHSYHQKKALGVLTTIIGIGADIGTHTTAAGQATELGGLLLSRGYSRGQEREADEHGLQLMASAGYHPDAALAVITALGRVSGNKGSSFFQTHPSPPDRLGYLRDDISHLTPASPPDLYLTRSARPVVMVFPFTKAGPQREAGTEDASHFFSDRFATSLLEHTHYTILDYRSLSNPVAPEDPQAARDLAQAAGADYFVVGSIPRFQLGANNQTIRTAWTLAASLYSVRTGQLVQSLEVPVDVQAPRRTGGHPRYECRVLLQQTCETVLAHPAEAITAAITADQTRQRAARAPVNPRW